MSCDLERSGPGEERSHPVDRQSEQNRTEQNRTDTPSVASSRRQRCTHENHGECWVRRIASDRHRCTRPRARCCRAGRRRSVLDRRIARNSDEGSASSPPSVLDHSVDRERGLLQSYTRYRPDPCDGSTSVSVWTRVVTVPFHISWTLQLPPWGDTLLRSTVTV